MRKKLLKAEMHTLQSNEKFDPLWIYDFIKVHHKDKIISLCNHNPTLCAHTFMISSFDALFHSSHSVNVNKISSFFFCYDQDINSASLTEAHFLSTIC